MEPEIWNTLCDTLGNSSTLVIMAVLVIVVMAMIIMGLDAKEIVTNSLSGLFGIAVGKATK